MSTAPEMVNNMISSYRNKPFFVNRQSDRLYCGAQWNEYTSFGPHDSSRIFYCVGKHWHGLQYFQARGCKFEDSIAGC